MPGRYRLDVRRMLLARGWAEDDTTGWLLRRGAVAWAPSNGRGDSSMGMDSEDGGCAWTIEFPGGVPARVIVAACETAARSPRPGRRRPTAAVRCAGIPVGGDGMVAEPCGWQGRRTVFYVQVGGDLSLQRAEVDLDLPCPGCGRQIERERSVP